MVSKCVVIFAAITLAAFAACSKRRSNPTGPGAHPKSWTEKDSPDCHGKKVASEGSTLCLECHTVTAPAGQQAKALSCANTAACHASASGPDKLNCGTCHKTFSGAHGAHFSVSIHDCAVCHSQTRDAHAALIDSVHMDAKVEVAFGQGATGTFTGTTCTSSNCHLGTSPGWTSGTALDCNGCHQKDALPGAHAAHLFVMANDCSICHSATVSNATTIINRAKHVNKVVDVLMTATWGGSFNTGTGSCDNTYCHNPLGGGSSPAWTSGVPLDCQSCHPNAALPNAHGTHLPRTGKRCDVCHNATATPTGTLKPGAPHVNRANDVVMLAGLGTYGASTFTCSGGGCHATASLAWK